MVNHGQDLDFVHNVVDLLKLDDFAFLQDFDCSELAGSLLFRDTDTSERTFY